MIKHIVVEPYKHANIVFPIDPLAHQYLANLNGIEIGAAAHNPFKLEGSTSVGLHYKDLTDYEFFASEQIKMCGAYAEIEVDAEADDLPFGNATQDYVLTSHVIEHLCNPIKAFFEWDRVLKMSGYVYMIFPKRDALPADRERPITPLMDFIRSYEEGWTVDTVPQEFMQYVPGGRRGHYWVFTLNSMMELIIHFNRLNHDSSPLRWEFMDSRETDTKVGNGHTLVLRKELPPPKLDINQWFAKYKKESILAYP